jgi:undecaprenyl diphosphate synthase
MVDFADMTGSDPTPLRIPNHLAIIMDGNGRWAEQRRLPRIVGHRKGVETVQTVVAESLRLGIRQLTLYAFSSENWGRPRDEVEALMGLLATFLQRELKSMRAQGIRLTAIGELDRLPAKIRTILEKTIQDTAGNRSMTLTLALSYGSRNELTRAARRLAQQVAAGVLAPGAIDETSLAGALDTAPFPDPDLVIRTSGEMRISNFLLWQAAYAEFYFTEVLWPDFSVSQLHAALAEFARRERRFGLTAAQLARNGNGGGD